MGRLGEFHAEDLRARVPVVVGEGPVSGGRGGGSGFGLGDTGLLLLGLLLLLLGLGAAHAGELIHERVEGGCLEEHAREVLETLVLAEQTLVVGRQGNVVSGLLSDLSFERGNVFCLALE